MKSIKFLSALALFVSFSTTFNVGFAQANAPSSLTQTLEKISTFQAHFTQKITDMNGEHIAKSQGELTILRPNRFYWKSGAPDPIIVVADGKYLWTYDIDLSQVTKQDLKEALGSSPAAILAGEISQLSQNFKISFGKKNQCQNSDECYSLRPIKKDVPFSDIFIGFSKGEVSQLRMHDSLGQDILTVFSHVKINNAVNKQLFSFKPPKGIDIIHAGN